MEYLKEYVHKKGGHYLFIGITVPINDPTFTTVENSEFEEYDTVFHTEDQIDIPLYRAKAKLPYVGGAGVMYSNTTAPLAIYQAISGETVRKVFARPVDMFFGPAEETSALRFTKID